MKEAVLAGFIFIKTASEGILTKDTIPPQFMPSVEDTEKKASLYVRHGVTEQAARSTGAEKSVKQHVAAFEGRDSPCAQTGEVASNQTCASSETSGSTTSNSKAYGAERKTAAKGDTTETFRSSCDNSAKVSWSWIHSDISWSWFHAKILGKRDHTEAAASSPQKGSCHCCEDRGWLLLEVLRPDVQRTDSV